MIFLSQLNREKKWAFGQKARKPLKTLGFLLAKSIFKSGQKVGKWPENDQKS
jgi:hypothetical protein